MAKKKSAGKAAQAKSEAPRRQDEPFVMVGVGASAGGLDALKGLLNALPKDTGMAFIVVQHMDPTMRAS